MYTLLINCILLKLRLTYFINCPRESSKYTNAHVCVVLIHLKFQYSTYNNVVIILKNKHDMVMTC